MIIKIDSVCSFIFLFYLPVEEVTSNNTNSLPKNEHLMYFFHEGEQQWKIIYKKNKKTNRFTAQ